MHLPLHYPYLLRGDPEGSGQFFWKGKGIREKAKGARGKAKGEVSTHPISTHPISTHQLFSGFSEQKAILSLKVPNGLPLGKKPNPLEKSKIDPNFPRNLKVSEIF